MWMILFICLHPNNLTYNRNSYIPLFRWCVKLALSIKTYSMSKTSPVTSHLHIDQGAELIWQSVCTHTPSCVGTPLHWSVYWSGIIICPWDTSDVPLATFWSLDLCSTPLLSSQDNPSLLVNTTSATRGDSELLKPHSFLKFGLFKHLK